MTRECRACGARVLFAIEMRVHGWGLGHYCRECAHKIMRGLGISLYTTNPDEAKAGYERWCAEYRVTPDRWWADTLPSGKPQPKEESSE